MGVGVAGEIDVAGGVQCDACENVFAATAQIARIGQYRVDDQSALGVVRAQGDADPIFFDDIARGDDFLTAGADLVGIGWVLAQDAGLGMDQQRALAVCRDALRPLVGEHNLLGIGARVHDEVVFQLALIAVVGHVDARVDGVELDARRVGDMGAPALRVGAAQIMADTGER